MKKIILSLAIIVTTLFSCSTDDVTTFEPKTTQSSLSNKNHDEFYLSLRDTTGRGMDTIIESVNPKPIKP